MRVPVFLSLSVLTTFVSSSSLAVDVCGFLMDRSHRPAPLVRGLDPEEHNALLAKRIAFQKTAKGLNSDLRVIDLAELDQLKKEKIVIGFVGYSGGSDFNLQASTIAITNFLRELELTRVVLASGATNEGVPALVYEIGHRLGFETLGITSLKAGDHSPSRMDYLLVEGNNWGRESNYFLSLSDIIVGFGGGGQSRGEMLTAKAMGKPVVLVVNREIRGAAATVPGKKHTKGEDAGRRVRQIIDDVDFFKWVRKLPDETHYVVAEDLPEVFPKNRIIGFTGWSLSGSKKNRNEQVRKFVEDFLDEFDPSVDIVGTGGTHVGAERIVHEVAESKGFRVVALVSHEIADPKNLLFPGTYAVIPVSKTWNGRTHAFVNHIDALVSFGGGTVVSEQFNLSSQRGIPAVHMVGNFRTSDRLVSDGSRRFRSGKRAARKIISGWAEMSQ